VKTTAQDPVALGRPHRGVSGDLAIPKSENPPRPDMASAISSRSPRRPRDQKHIEEVEIKDREYTFPVKDPNRRVHPNAVVRSAPLRQRAGLLSSNVEDHLQKDEGTPF